MPSNISAEDRSIEQPDFPESLAPIAPILSSHTLGKDNHYNFPTLLDIKYKIDITSGRAAIALALIHSKIGAGDEVLAPAFHCESMIEPIRHVGAHPIFYPIRSETRIDLEKCTSLITSETKAIIVTHYFGFPQDLKAIQAYCKVNNLVLIEDCAHSIFGSYQGNTLGSIGDYAIASTMKFFPVYDGGILASSKHHLDDIELTPCSLGFEIKSFLTIIERSARMGRFSLMGKMIVLLANAKDKLWQAIKRTFLQAEILSSAPPAADGGFSFDVKWIDTKASRSSLAVVSHTNRQRVVELRQANYQHYLNELVGIKGLHFLHPTLPKMVVPLVVPILFDNASHVFNVLKSNGVPIWRFGEFLDSQITSDVCPRSLEYSANLLQFPCHQELKNGELSWIIDQIKSALELTKGYTD